LFSVLCGLLGIGIRLQLMNGLVQALRFVSISDSTLGHIGTRVYACRISAETIEIQSKIMASVKSGKTSIQCREWRTRVGGRGIRR
jgi:hypothetical protein